MVVFGLSVRLSWYHNVDAMVAVMRALLFVLHVCMLRECEDDCSICYIKCIFTMYYDLYYCYCIMNTLFLHGENSF